MAESSEEISIQRFNKILKTVFELLWFEPQGLYISEIIGYIKNAIPLTEFETGVYPFSPQMPRFEAIVRIGTIPFEKVGWLEKTKNGRWYITVAGREACNQYKDSEKFFELSAELFEDWKLKEAKRLAIINKDTFANAVEFSWEQIREYFHILDISDVRILVTSLLKALGFHVNWTGPLLEDACSLDMICSTDPLGLKPPRIFVHITKNSQLTTLENVNIFSQDLEPNDIGIIFSFGGFENGLVENSLDTKQPLIRLIDLEKFVDLWTANLSKIDQVGISKFPLRPIHFLTIPNRG